jgi:cytochrome oxidase Cu insertion factor (SCO1/SenC/PrrC family)
MKRALALIALLSAMPLASSLARQEEKKPEKEEMAKISLKVGDEAPDFTLLSDKWKTVKLSDFRGKKNVFLAVYVLAFTGG